MNSIVSAAAVASAAAIPTKPEVVTEKQLLDGFEVLDPRHAPAAAMYISKLEGAESSLMRAEQAVSLLRTRHVREGWKIDEQGAERCGLT